MKGFLGLTPARHFLQFDPLRMCASRRRSAVMSYRVAFKLVMEVIELTSMSQRAGSIVFGYWKCMESIDARRPLIDQRRRDGGGKRVPGITSGLL